MAEIREQGSEGMTLVMSGEIEENEYFTSLFTRVVTNGDEGNQEVVFRHNP